MVIIIIIDLWEIYMHILILLVIYMINEICWLVIRLHNKRDEIWWDLKGLNLFIVEYFTGFHDHFIKLLIYLFISWSYVFMIFI